MRNTFVLFFVVASQFLWAQSPDFLTGDISIVPNLENHQIKGQVDYTFRVRKSVDSLRLDAVNMQFESIKVNNRKVKFSYNNQRLAIAGPFHNGKHDLHIAYLAEPKQTVYFTESPHGKQVWTQGQGKENSHWVPSFNDVNEKILFSISALLPEGYQFISNGEHRIKERSGELMRWKFAMHQPMSSYLLGFVIGHFKKHEQQSTSGVVIENYVEPHEEQKAEPTYRYTAQILDFLEKETGVNYPWNIYRNIPLRNFLYGGMENTTLTTFNRSYVVDSIGYNDVNYVNVNAHEMAHHWFGDYVTAKNSTHHWLQEGFATYYALLAEEALFGEDYLVEKLYRMAIELEKASATDKVPVLNAKASSLSFYKKGAWALHDLRHQMGKAAFQRAVKSYLLENAYKNVDTDDFFKHVSKESTVDLRAFQARWLDSDSFPEEHAMAILAESDLLKSFFEIATWVNLEETERVARYKQYLESNPVLSDLLWEELIYQWNLLSPEQQENMAQYVDKSESTHAKMVWLYQQKSIPNSLLPKVENWLQLDSYVLKELVLDRLCRENTASCASYLNQLDQVIGLNDSNVRQVWLTLALKLPNFRTDKKASYYDELLTLAKVPNEFSTRIGAIEKLVYLHRADENVLPLLVEALDSHNWQFSKYGRDQIRALLKNDVYIGYFEKLLSSQTGKRKTELARLLAEKKAP